MSEKEQKARQGGIFGKLRRWVARTFLFILLAYGVVVGASLWELLQYRFTVLPPPVGIRVKALTVFGATIDAMFMATNRIERFITLDSVPESFPLPVVEILVGLDALDEMASDPPRTAKARYYPARVRYPDGELRNSKLRFRGRSFWHFHREKPSLRLRLADEDPLHLRQSINFVNPEDRAMVSNLIGEELARKLGVVAPVTDLVGVFINAEYGGVYQRTTHDDSLMLHMNRRMPGPLFSGEHLNREWVASDFDVKGELSEIGYRALRKLIEALDMPLSTQSMNQLWSVLSLEKYASWVATMNLAGGIHTDFVHNNLFYYDSAFEKLEPVVSDINGHGLQTGPREGERLNIFRSARYDIPLNERMHPILNRALRDPRFHHLRNIRLHQALVGVGSLSEQWKWLQAMFSRVNEAAYADGRKGAIELSFVGWYRFPYSNRQFDKAWQRLLRWTENRDHYLKEHLYMTDVEIWLQVTENPEEVDVVIAVDGNSGVVLTIPLSAEQVKFENSDGMQQGLPMRNGRLLLMPGLREEDSQIYPPTRLNREPEHALVPSAQQYHLTVTGVKQVELEKMFREGFRHALTEEAIEPKLSQRKVGEPVVYEPSPTTLHSWNLPGVGEEALRILGPGKVVLPHGLQVSDSQKLQVLPGTELVLEAGSSLVIEGKAEIVGKSTEPVTIVSEGQLGKRGIIVLRGSGASGSVFRHVRVQRRALPGSRVGNELAYIQLVGVENVAIDDLLFDVVPGEMLGLSTTYAQVKIDNLGARCEANCLDFRFSNIVASGLSLSSVQGDVISLRATNFHGRSSGIKAKQGSALIADEESYAELEADFLMKGVPALVVSGSSLVDLSKSDLLPTSGNIKLIRGREAFVSEPVVRLQNREILESSQLQVEYGGACVVGDPNASKDTPNEVHALELSEELCQLRAKSFAESSSIGVQAAGKRDK